MEPLTHWPWPRSLAMAQPDSVVEVDDILFGAIRQRCSEMGVRKGSVITCLDHGDEWVDVELPSGDNRRLTRAYAWFISVREPGSVEASG
ncbi:MAG: FeoA domain-containing protein [Candidatus Longimicrobiales bacterium M2_2A_002]